MSKIDKDWASAQMAEAKIKKSIGASVMILIEAWEMLRHAEKDSQEVLDLFSRLAMTKALVEENPEQTWVDARPGFIKVGDIVRVKQDAYTGNTGVMHNGRLGKVVAVRYGDVIFRSTDGKQPFIDGTHHSPYKLEKRIK
jgi:hypothetical protein